MDRDRMDELLARRRTVAATWWAAGVLALGTALLVSWVAFLVAAVRALAGAIGLPPSSGLDGLDLVAIASSTGPALVAGWVVGLGAARIFGPGERLRPWAVGGAAGVLGCLVGALVLHASRVL